MLAIFVGVRAEHLAADKHIEVLQRQTASFFDEWAKNPLPAHIDQR